MLHFVLIQLDETRKDRCQVRTYLQRGNRHYSKSIEGIALTLSSPNGGAGAHHYICIGQLCVVHNIPIC